MDETRIVPLFSDTQKIDNNTADIENSGTNQVVSLPDEREKRHKAISNDADSPIPTIQLSDLTEKSRNHLKRIVEGKVAPKVHEKCAGNKHVNLQYIFGVEACENLPPDDPIYEQASYLDSLLNAIASDIGERNTSKISDAIADMLRHSLEFGKFLHLIEEE